MKSLFSVLLIFFINSSIFSQKDVINLSKIKLCETKISDFKESFKIIPVIELDVCPNGIRPLKIPGYQQDSGYTFSSYKNVIFQIHLADSTIYKIILNKEFKGYLTDGEYIDISTLKAKDMVDKGSVFWFIKCSGYLGLVYKNILFYIKQDKSILPEDTINKEFYSDKNIEIITIESNCYKKE